MTCSIKDCKFYDTTMEENCSKGSPPVTNNCPKLLGFELFQIISRLQARHLLESVVTKDELRRIKTLLLDIGFYL